MSGPKLSKAELEAMRKAQLERERLEAIRILKEARERYQDACNEVQRMRMYIQNLLSKTQAVYRSDAQRKADDILSTLPMDVVVDTKSAQSYQEAADAINRAIPQVKKQLDHVFQQAVQQSQADSQITQASYVQQAFQSMVGQKDSNVGVLQIDFRCQYDDQKLIEQVSTMIVHFQNQADYTDNPQLCVFSQKSAKHLEGILNNPQTLAKKQDIYDMMQILLNEEEEIHRLYQELQSLYAEYVTFASLTDVQPKNPEDFDDAKAIKDEIDRLRNLYRKLDEMDYIADKINEVMVRMGYGFVISKVLTRKNGDEMDFSLYEADDSTGIAVYTDQKGAVMMQMTVLGDDSEITDEDREFSFQRQIDFCSAHPDLIEALSQEGIFLKQTDYKEPDRKYTTKIDKKVYGGKGMQAKQHKVDRRKRRRGGKKMRTL